MAKASQWNLKKQIKSQKEYLQCQAMPLYERALAAIPGALQPEDKRVVVLSLKLNSLAAAIGTQGAIAVLEGDSTGWHMIEKAYEYRFWSCYLGVEGFLKGKLGTFHAVMTHCLLHSLWRAFPERVAWLLHALDRSRTKPPSGMLVNWTPFNLFAFALAEWGKNSRTPDWITSNALGLFAPVMEGLASVEMSPEVLKAVCEHHFDYSPYGKYRNDVGAPFVWAPYNMMPIELFALDEVRRARGLTLPVVEHPLMETPLAHPPRLTERVQDSLLTQILDVAREDLPLLQAD